MGMTPAEKSKAHRARSVPVSVLLSGQDGETWKRLCASYGGQKPALLALLRSHVGATPSPRQGAVRFFAVAALLPEKEGLEFQAECEKHGDAESAIIALLRGKENG